MEIGKQQNEPAFGAKIGKIEPCLIVNSSVSVGKAILDSIARLKTIADDTVEFSMKNNKNGPYSSGFLEIHCKKQLGDTPILAEPKTKLGKLWHKLFPPKAPQPKVVEDYSLLDRFEASEDNIFKTADKIYNNSRIQNAIKKFEIEERAQGLGIIK
jgi:hypothetical protein